MPAIQLNKALRKEYENLFNSCSIRPERIPAVDTIVVKLLAKKDHYQKVSSSMGIPWSFIAVIHNMESGLDFTKHLHNGDPLTSRTLHIPAGRPRRGNPPFTWEESAIDALSLRRITYETDWSLAGTLYQLEGYNGFGYRNKHPYVLTPYLWSFSSHYASGKYIADGTWSDTAISKQCGAAVLLRRMAEHGHIEFPDQPAPQIDTLPIVVSYSMHKSNDSLVVARVIELQRWLNTFPGIFVNPDGVPGKLTSQAYKKVTGVFLPGDPRG